MRETPWAWPRRTSISVFLAAGLMLAVSGAGLPGVTPRALAAGASGDLDQCANGGVGKPDLTCTGSNWQNGNLVPSHAHYNEGDSVPYRLKLAGVAPGSHTVVIGWDTLKGGKHALDYLTTYNRTETDADPCSNVTGCLPPVFTTLPIPKDPKAPAGQIPGVFTLFGGVLNSTGNYVYDGEETRISITFTANGVTNPVLAWGGHIATRQDWGADNSAVAISGSPFHMRLKSVDGSGGNQDRALSNDAVIFPASITIVKVAAPKASQTFGFTATGVPPVTSFTLVDDGDASAPVDRQTFGAITDFATTRTVTENEVPGWTLTGIGCVDPSGGTTTAGRAASIKLSEGEEVVCTFSNVRNPSITVLKEADPTSIDEPGGRVKFSVAVRNDSAVESVTLVALADAPYGNVAAVGGQILETTCSVPTTIAPNGTYSCWFHANVAGDAATTVTDVVTATAKDLRDKTLTDTDDAVVSILDVKPGLQVDKSVSPSLVAEPGGKVTYTVSVTNPSKEPLTLTSLTDDKFGPLAGKGSCGVPQTIAAGARYTCTFDADVAGDPRTPHVNTVTGVAKDNENNEVRDAGVATVDFSDVVPELVVDKSAGPSEVPEPGGKVTFTVVVTNPAGAVESFNLTALRDSAFGNLDGAGTCDVSPAVELAPGAKYTCAFDQEIPGNAKATHLNTVTATIRDDDGNTVTGDDDATVTFTDVVPTIEVEKTALPASLPEPGGDVTFGVKVTNPATAVEPIRMTSLVDDIYGDLVEKGSCFFSALAPVILLPGQTYSCSFTVKVTGNPGETKTDTITGTARDDENNEVSDTALASVVITDVVPRVTVDKTADPATVPEPGGPVTFTVRVTNPGGAVEPIVLSELTDSAYGDLDGAGSCDVTPAITLAIGGEYVCTFTKTVTGDAGFVHTNRAVASVTDDENNRVTGSDDATVTVTDVLPTILVDKAAGPDLLPEPGGPVRYTVTITNTSVETVTLRSLSDAPGGDLAGQGTCLPGREPVTILAGRTYTCAFTVPVTGDAGSKHPDTVTATAVDNENNPVTGRDTAEVTIVDVKPVLAVDKGAAPSEVAEPGGNVWFTVAVTNPLNAVEPVTLTSLTDSVFGNLDGQGTCKLAEAGPIAIGGRYTCTFQHAVSGNAGFEHRNTVTAVGNDNEGNSTPPATDDAIVTVLNVAPDLVVDKLASPRALPEPGGTVAFTVTVTNPGTAEELRLTSLKDNVYGDLNGKGDCAVPQTIAPMGRYSCTFSGDVKGDAGSSHRDTVTGVAQDDDGNDVSDAAEAVVQITDVAPAVLVAKSAAPSSLPEPGGTAAFTVTVTNPATAIEPITVSSLVDSVFGNVGKKGTCDLPTGLDPGEVYSCEFPGAIAGNAGFVHTDQVTATASDNEGNEATATDTAEVTLSDVLPAIKLDKTAAVSTIHADDEVTYTYAVRVMGIEPLSNVAVSDDKCRPVTLAGGDTDQDSVLDLGETWTFTCAAKLSGTTTNTATGSGQDDDGNTATDLDSATVTVVDPRIVLDKVADTQVTTGDSVTYTYTVTNPGDAPLSDVVVTDDKCGPVSFSGGDTDGDSLLDPGESWRFTCTAILSNAGQITNTGTVRARDPIGKDVTSVDTAVVSVLDTVVLPATESRPETQPLVLPRPLPTLPVTGADAVRWAASGLALIAGGAVLRGRRRKP